MDMSRSAGRRTHLSPQKSRSHTLKPAGHLSLATGLRTTVYVTKRSHTHRLSFPAVLLATLTLSGCMTALPRQETPSNRGSLARISLVLAIAFA